MKALHILRTAVRSLRRNVMRAILTTLGVIIGVASVITMIELGNGFTVSFMDIVGAKAADTIMVFPGATDRGGVNSGKGGSRTLTARDAERIASDCPAVGLVAPVVQSGARLVYGNRNWSPSAVYGTTPAFLELQNAKLTPGSRAFSEADVKSHALVCVVGATVVKELFNGRSPIGAEMRMNGVPVRVVGSLVRKGREGMGFEQDDAVILPWTTLTSRLSDANAAAAAFSSVSSGAAASATALDASSFYASGASPVPVRFGNIDMILLTARSSPEVDLAGEQVTALLRANHRLAAAAPDDFSLMKMSGMIEKMRSAISMAATFLLSIGMIALLVGGVGIMNIMLVSVTERTREIGLRMAVGAEARDILLQFLTEAVVLCTAGGVAGILLGRGCSMLLSRALGWPTSASVGAIVTSFLVAGAVGVIFGFYPAWKASKLDPIEALRHE